jgi:predicted transcriptional regulator
LKAPPDNTQGNKEFWTSIGGLAVNGFRSSGSGSMAVENSGPVSVTVVATSSAGLNHKTHVTLYRQSRRVDTTNKIIQNFGKYVHLGVYLQPHAKLAQASGRSSNFLISDAIECYDADHERLMAEVGQANRQLKAGHYIRNEDVKAWLLSWGTRHELPIPRCVCGKRPMARNCARRDRLVASSHIEIAADSYLRGAPQTRGGRTAGYSDGLRLSRRCHHEETVQCVSWDNSGRNTGAARAWLANHSRGRHPCLRSNNGYRCTPARLAGSPGRGLH